MIFQMHDHIIANIKAMVTHASATHISCVTSGGTLLELSLNDRSVLVSRARPRLEPGMTVKLRYRPTFYELVAIRGDSGVLWGPLGRSLATGSGALLADLEQVK